MIGNDLGQLVLDIFRLDGLATDGRESLGCFLEFACCKVSCQIGEVVSHLLTLLYIETWGLRKEEQAKTDDDCPEELNSDRDSIGAGVETILRCIHDTVGEKNADGDAKLVAGDEGTANSLGGYFRHIQDDDS